LPQPQTNYQQAKDAAHDALDRHDWAVLRFNAQLMMHADLQHAAAWSYLGIANYNLGRDAGNRAQAEEGLSQIINATRLDPNSFVALSNHALALLNERQFEEGLDVMARAEMVAPLNVKNLMHRFWAEVHLDRCEDAERTLQGIAAREDSALAVLPLEWVWIGGQRRQLARGLSMSFTFDGEEYRVEENDFDSFGRGETLREALTDYGDEFEMLVEEYVETDDPLDDEARKMAERLQAHL